ncbi:MAG: substrate-binding domain-containing protein [Bacteroidota bacterium]
MKQSVIWIMLGAFSIACFFSCNGKGKQSASQDRRFTVGICVAQETEATREMHLAIDERAVYEDANILWASAEQNEAAQEKIFKEFFDKGAKGIIFEPVNLLTAGLLIDDAISRGISIAGIGALPEAKQVGVFIMPDLENAAEKLVCGVVEKQRKQGRILILTAEIPDSQEVTLLRSMLKNLRENGSEYQAFGLSTDSGTVRRAMNSILFAPSPPTAVIATHALYILIASDLFRLGLVSPRPILACYSEERRARDALHNGLVDIVVDPQPAEIGTTALSSIVRLIKRLPLETHSKVIRSGQLPIPIIKTPVQISYSQHISRH